MATFRFIEWLIDWFLEQEEFFFDWDKGNQTKNLQKHGITCDEVESVFLNVPSIRILGVQITPAIKDEERYGMFGVTTGLRPLFICFTIREEKIRIIHARKMNKKERITYASLCEE